MYIDDVSWTSKVNPAWTYYCIVSGTGLSGTITTNTVSITVNGGPLPTVTAIANPNPICTGNSLTLTEEGTGTTSWVWSGPDGYNSTLQNSTLTITGTMEGGVYTVTATNHGCSASGSTSPTTVNTIPIFVTSTAVPNPVCAGNSITLTESDNGGIGWSWSGPNGYTSALQSPTLTITGTVQEGVYTVTASNSCGSAISSTSSVKMNTGSPTSVTAIFES